MLILHKLSWRLFFEDVDTELEVLVLFFFELFSVNLVQVWYESCPFELFINCHFALLGLVKLSLYLLEILNGRLLAVLSLEVFWELQRLDKVSNSLGVSRQRTEQDVV